ncbi:MAG: hypothetical protein PUC44_02055 [Eubacteriales bacterium]|nr:hypothetical protein [Eubacteriales bacterium]
MEGYRFYELLLIFVFYSFLGWLIEEIVVAGLLGKHGKRGFLTGPFGVTYGIGGAAGTLLLTKIPETPIRFLVVLAIAFGLNLLGILLVRIMAGRLLWKFSFFATLFAGVCAFVFTTDLTPILRVIVMTVPAKFSWILLLVFCLWIWQDFVDSCGYLWEYRKKGIVPVRWRKAYGW